MRQRLNLWAVVITAIITFGSLMAFVGHHPYGDHRWGYHGWGGRGQYGHHDRYRYNHGDCDGQKTDRAKGGSTDTSSIQ